MSVQSLSLRHGTRDVPASFALIDALPGSEFLGEREIEIAGAMRFAAKREGFLLGRCAAKCALGALLEEPDLRRIEIHSGIYGQPLISHPRAGPLEVSVSHSRGVAAALAFPAAFPMGIDLETVAAIDAAAIVGELEPSLVESEWLASAGVDEATACGILWTAREALGKALRLGLNSPLGILSLGEIRATGEARWMGRYLRFPRCACLIQSSKGRVLSIAMPVEVEMIAWPRLNRLSPGP